VALLIYTHDVRAKISDVDQSISNDIVTYLDIHTTSDIDRRVLFIERFELIEHERKYGLCHACTCVIILIIHTGLSF
jgi:hypothetical protein